MKLLDVSPTPAGDKKKFVATFTLDNGKRKLVKFGIKGSRSYVDGAPIGVRDAYRARHAGDIGPGKSIASPGMLSYWITWGDSQSLERNVAEYKRKHNI